MDTLKKERKLFTLDFTNRPMDETHPNFAFFKALEETPPKCVTIAANERGVFLPDGSFVDYDDPKCPTSKSKLC